MNRQCVLLTSFLFFFAVWSPILANEQEFDFLRKRFRGQSTSLESPEVQAHAPMLVAFITNALTGILDPIQIQGIHLAIYLDGDDLKLIDYYGAYTNPHQLINTPNIIKITVGLGALEAYVHFNRPDLLRAIVAHELGHVIQQTFDEHTADIFAIKTLGIPKESLATMLKLLSDCVVQSAHATKHNIAQRIDCINAH